MKTLVTVMTAAAMTLGVVGTSQAADVAFKYNPNASVPSVYKKLNTQAKKVCVAELGPLRHYGLIDCVEDYVGQIVDKIDRVELTAYHNQMTSEDKVIKLAQLDK